METWKPIPEHSAYQASSEGRIRSIDRIVTQPCAWGRGNKISYSKKGFILKPLQGSHKYQGCCLNEKRYYWHRIICTVFHGNPPSKKHQVNHINGNKLDNRAVNLEWVTPKQNGEHAAKNHLPKYGEDHYHCKLSDKKLLEIKRILFFKRSKCKPYLKDIAKQFGLSPKYVENLFYGLRRKKFFYDPTTDSLKLSTDL